MSLHKKKDDAVVINADYFRRAEARKLRAVANGRHPRSFGRVSEVWHHALSTGKRLSAIRAGHDIWTVAEECEEAIKSFSASSSKSPASSTSSPLQPTTTNFASLSATSSDDVQQEAASLGQIDFSVNGLHIDIRNKLILHYGMLVILMSDKQDIVCVTSQGQPLMKHVSSILPSDKTLFKLVDLREATNPHPIKYGDPVWLQIVDPQLGSNTNSSWHQSTALCTKLFSLNEMDTAHLNPMWVKDAAREALLDRIQKQHAQPEEPPPSSTTGSPSMLLKKEGEEMAGGEHQQQQKEGGGATGGNAKPGRMSKWKALKDANIVKKINDEKNAEAVKQGAISSGEGANKQRGSGATAHIGDAAKVDASVAKAPNLHDPEAAIMGGTQAVLIGAHALATAKKNDSDLSILQASSTSKVVSREAWQMGQMAFNSASHSHLPELQLGEPVCSNTVIFVSQDLYCLASSQGSTYLPWPLSSHDIAPHTISPVASPGKAPAPVHDDDDDASVHSHQSLRSLGSKIAAATKSQNQSTTSTTSTKASSHHHLVSRKIIHKTSAIYPYKVDKRCVFQFCTVDNVADTSELSAQERTAQKLIVKAKTGLRRSEMLRKGAKTYPLPDDDPSQKPISSGEQFSRILRHNLSSKLLEREEAILRPRRDKEGYIKQHFAQYCVDWDHGDRGDDVSVASKSVGGLSARNRRHDAPPAGLEQPSMQSLQSMQSEDSPGPQSVSKLPDRTPLPANHRELYLQTQEAILEESRASSVLRPYHKERRPTPSTSSSAPPLNYLDSSLSPGETIVSLRQALQGIESKVEQALRIESALQDADQSFGPSASGNRRGAAQNQSPVQGGKRNSAASETVLQMISIQDVKICRGIDHHERMTAISNVKNALVNINHAMGHKK